MPSQKYDQPHFIEEMPRTVSRRRRLLGFFFFFLSLAAFGHLSISDLHEDVCQVKVAIEETARKNRLINRV